MKEYKDLTKDEQELDDYLCSEEHNAYFIKKLRRGLKLPPLVEDDDEI